MPLLEDPWAASTNYIEVSFTLQVIIFNGGPYK